MITDVFASRNKLNGTRVEKEYARTENNLFKILSSYRSIDFDQKLVFYDSMFCQPLLSMIMIIRIKKIFFINCSYVFEDEKKYLLIKTLRKQIFLFAEMSRE